MSFASDPKVLRGVAERALEEVPPPNGDGSPLRIGLGTGRAAEAFIAKLGDAVKGGLAIVGVPTSERSDKLARDVGIPVGTLAGGRLDVAFDGADEVDPRGQLTKGLGGAMLRERIVASEADKFVVLVTSDKLVQRLGARSPLPVEVVPFALDTARRRLEKFALKVVPRRKKDSPDLFLTDNGNYVLDAHASEAWDDPERLDRDVRGIPGVVDTGFFFKMTSLVIVGGPDGTSAVFGN